MHTGEYEQCVEQVQLQLGRHSAMSRGVPPLVTCSGLQGEVYSQGRDWVQGPARQHAHPGLHGFHVVGQQVGDDDPQRP